MEKELTITEGLAEIKTIKSRLEKKIQFLTSNCFTFEHSKDVDKKKEEFKKEYQSFVDLSMRLVKIRTAIAKANLETVIMSDNTILEALVKKREIDQEFKKLLKGSIATFEKEDAILKSRPQIMGDKESGNMDIVKVVPCFDVEKFRERLDKQLTYEGEIDGLLSLKNATTKIKL